MPTSGRAGTLKLGERLDVCVGDEGLRGTSARTCSGTKSEGADGHLIPDEEAWFVADTIPNVSAAAILLLEHRWAVPFRDPIVDAGGIALADEWIHPEDLVAIGLEGAAE